MKTKHKFIGRVFDFKTRQPLKGVSITHGETKVLSNSQGLFEITLEFEMEEVKKGIKTFKTPPQPLKISLKGYTTSTTPIKTQNNTLKTNQLNIALKNSKVDMSLEIDKVKTEVQEEIKKVPTNVDPMALFIKYIYRQILDIQSKLIPLTMALLFKFGVSKAKDALTNFIENKAKCPSDTNSIIKQRNNLVHKLNQIQDTLDVMAKTAGIVGGIATVFIVIKDILLILPAPTLPGTPMGVLINLAHQVEKFDKLAKQIQGISLSALAALIVLRSTLGLLISILNSLDTLIGKCNPSGDLTVLNDGIGDLAIPLEKTSESSKSVNGFTFAVEIFKDNPNQRQAVAKDPHGVIILRGEPSFSASEDILIDELAFYIKSNDLKAI